MAPGLLAVVVILSKQRVYPFPRKVRLSVAEKQLFFRPESFPAKEIHTLPSQVYVVPDEVSFTWNSSEVTFPL
ncbi:Uncharacterised protein [Chlamydia abortus]|nr:Uncharacterised protein [Chlamydia abortus]SFW01671.1 Uncharacterised protein [Chlamydia abortus]SFW02368.1 Uncharacterised protein [Chlamydia abortus]SFW03831.1 Uncharacterised protein [Chlamydia abortus]SGA29272.1 Uncharacterised protein [Chlamydia abortus]